MKNQFVNPVVRVAEVRMPSNGNHVDVAYTKIIPNPANNNPFSLGYQLKGHPNAVVQNDKTLMVWVRYQDAKNFTDLGWSVGDDVNTKTNNPVIVDIVDYETTMLTKNHGLDKEGNVRREPVLNPQTGEFVQSVDGKLIFRFVEFVQATNLEDLQAIKAGLGKIERKRTPSGLAVFGESFDGERKQEVDGRNVMTPEYQSFIQQMYVAYNGGVLTEITQESEDSKVEAGQLF